MCQVENLNVNNNLCLQRYKVKPRYVLPCGRCSTYRRLAKASRSREIKEHPRSNIFLIEEVNLQHWSFYPSVSQDSNTCQATLSDLRLLADVDARFYCIDRNAYIYLSDKVEIELLPICRVRNFDVCRI